MTHHRKDLFDPGAERAFLATARPAKTTAAAARRCLRHLLALLMAATPIAAVSIAAVSIAAVSIAAVPFAIRPARADQITLAPPSAQVEFRAYGLGLIPFDGKFTRFHGWLRYDPTHPDACQVLLEVDAASLAMSNETVRDQIKGPEFMDVLRLPELAFHGDCIGDVIAGNLLLHGENHPFNLDLTRSATTITAAGKLHRAEWGMTARRFTAGSTIRIKVEIPNPARGPRT